MSNFDRIAGVGRNAVFAVCGDMYEYRTVAGDAIEVSGIKRDAVVDQPEPGGVYLDLEVRPADLETPRIKDQVTIDGAIYKVTKVQRSVRRNWMLTLRRAVQG